MISVAALQESFVARLPWMRTTIRLAFPNLDADKKEEAVSVTIGLAWKSWTRLGERGLADNTMLLKSVLWYSIRQTRAGRSVCSAAKPKDPMSLRFYGKATFEPWDFDDYVGRETPIPDVVSFRIDVPAFLTTLTVRQRRMALDLATGMTTSDAAEKYGLSAGRISQFRREFRALFDLYFAD